MLFSPKLQIYEKLSIFFLSLFLHLEDWRVIPPIQCSPKLEYIHISRGVFSFCATFVHWCLSLSKKWEGGVFKRAWSSTRVSFVVIRIVDKSQISFHVEDVAIYREWKRERESKREFDSEKSERVRIYTRVSLFTSSRGALLRTGYLFRYIRVYKFGRGMQTRISYIRVTPRRAKLAFRIQPASFENAVYAKRHAAGKMKARVAKENSLFLVLWISQHSCGNFRTKMLFTAGKGQMTSWITIGWRRSTAPWSASRYPRILNCFPHLFQGDWSVERKRDDEKSKQPILPLTSCSLLLYLNNKISQGQLFIFVI